MVDNARGGISKFIGKTKEKQRKNKGNTKEKQRKNKGKTKEKQRKNKVCKLLRLQKNWDREFYLYILISGQLLFLVTIYVPLLGFFRKKNFKPIWTKILAEI